MLTLLKRILMLSVASVISAQAQDAVPLSDKLGTHNHDLLAFTASMTGHSRQAIGAADEMASLIPAEMLRAPGMTLLQNLLARPLQMRLRFGRWEEILQTAAPAEDLPYARAIWHYARGRALLAREDVRGAEAELVWLGALAQDPALAEVRLEFNPAPAVLGIALEVLAGQIAAARGDHERAIAHLREAARREDELAYRVPPEWPIPVRQELGAVLLAAHRLVEAEQAYREDLLRFPENGWSLHGLAQTLWTQGRPDESRGMEEQFRRAWNGADVSLPGGR